MRHEPLHLLCDCGYDVVARNEAGLVRRAQQHALRRHRMRLTAEQVLQVAFHAQLAGDGTWPTDPHHDGRP